MVGVLSAVERETGWEEKLVFCGRRLGKKEKEDELETFHDEKFKHRKGIDCFSLISACDLDVTPSFSFWFLVV